VRLAVNQHLASFEMARIVHFRMMFGLMACGWSMPRQKQAKVMLWQRVSKSERSQRDSMWRVKSILFHIRSGLVKPFISVSPSPRVSSNLLYCLFLSKAPCSHSFLHNTTRSLSTQPSHFHQLNPTTTTSLISISSP